MIEQGNDSRVSDRRAHFFEQLGLLVVNASLYGLAFLADLHEQIHLFLDVRHFHQHLRRPFLLSGLEQQVRYNLLGHQYILLVLLRYEEFDLVLVLGLNQHADPGEREASIRDLVVLRELQGGLRVLILKE